MLNFRTSQSFRLALATFVFAGTLLMLTNGTRLSAQAASPSPASEDSASSASKELPKASREAAKGESANDDEQAQFKHSWMVQWVGGITGLSVDNAYWLCVVLNFAVIAGTIFYFWQKNLPGVFRSRTASIQQSMVDARKASEEANRRLGEIETRLSRLDSEIGVMRDAAEKDAAAEEARIKAAAEEDARKIVESAEQEIAAAAKLARRELTAHAANLAVALAAKQIKVDESTDQALVREFARELSPKPGKDGN
jgi:F-type H+-transporting ATPase subunit b